MLPPDISAQLVQLLQQLQSADNTVRSQAEDVLQNQWTSQRPEWLLMGLAEQIGTSSDPSVRLALEWPPRAVMRKTIPYSCWSFILPAALFCCRYLSPDSLQDPQEYQWGERRPVHLP